MIKNKKILVFTIILSIIIIFMIFNVFWVMYYLKIKKYTEKVEKVDIGGEICYTLNKDDYKYNVILPSYLDFSTNLSISEPSVIVDDATFISGNLLLIWINPIKEPSFGIMISHKNSNNIYETYSYNIDNEGNLILRSEDDLEINIFNEHQEEIVNMLKAYNDIWSSIR